MGRKNIQGLSWVTGQKSLGTDALDHVVLPQQNGFSTQWLSRLVLAPGLHVSSRMSQVQV